MKKKKKRGFFRWLLFAFASIVVGGSVYSCNAQNVTGNVMPTPFGIGVGVVMSGSMEPEFSVDDLIVSVARDTFEVGDIIVYQQKRMLVVHKIIQIDGDIAITKGTANNTTDEPIALSDIKGEVVCKIKGVGKVVSWIKSPLGTTLILALAILLLVKSYQGENEEKSDEVLEIKKEIEKIKRENEK